jgi:cytochrome c2
MAGGRFIVDENGDIVLGSGEYHLDGIHTYDIGIQSRETSYGKILRIDPVTGDSEIIALGHRNVQGVAIDADGQVWTAEHGIRGGDELNHIKEGENHGWPLVSYGTLYSAQPLPVQGEQGQHEGFDKPAFAWLPSAGISTLTAIDDFHPAWDGGLLAGSLSSPEFGQSLWHIRTEGERVVFVERIELTRRVRDVQQFGKKIAIWSDPTSLIILEQQARKDPVADALRSIEADFGADTASTVQTVLQGCGQCHSYEQFKHAGAPSLNGVVGRRIAGTDYDGYSDALAGLGGVWTSDRLKAYLTDPANFAPGSAMPDPELDEGPILNAIVETLLRINTADDEHVTYN